MTWPHGDPDAVVERVLADPAYGTAPATSGHPPQQSLFVIVWNWLWERILHALHPLAHAAQASRGAGTVVGIVLIVASLAGLAFVVFRLVVAFVGPSVSRDSSRRASVPPAPEMDAGALRAQARAAAARREFARAIAALWSAAVADLDARAVVPFEASRTPGEYRRSVRRARAAASAAFDDLTERFVRALYAPGRTDADAYAAAERALAALEPALAG